CIDVPGKPERPVDVPGPDAGREAVIRVVGKTYQLFVAGKLDDADDGPEDLVPGDTHVVAHIGEDCRLEIPAAAEIIALRASAPCRDGGSIFDAVGDVTRDLVQLRL